MTEINENDLIKKEIIEIQNLENINAEQFANKKLKITGIPFRIKKETRLKYIKYKCPECEKKIKTTTEITKQIKCPYCTETIEPEKIKEEMESGFKITLINNLENIASSETIKVFVPISILKINEKIRLPTSIEKEFKEISEFLNLTGQTIKIIGTLQTKKIKNKTGETIIETELKAEDIEALDYLANFKLTNELQLELQKFFMGREWIKEEIDELIVPEIKGRALTKQLILLTALTPKALKTENNKVIFYGVGRGIIIGDYGEAKSEIIKQFIQRYCNGLNAMKISNETLTKAGLMAGITKDGEDWVIDWGILPWGNNGLIAMDGFHSFKKEDIASIRETEINNSIDIYKIVKGSRECAYRGIKIANCRKEPIRNYYLNKYQASFDIGFGESDEELKFSGADRRRVDWIIVYSKDDVENELVDESQLNALTEKQNTETQTHLNNLIKFAWKLKAEDIDWQNIEEIKKELKKELKKLRTENQGIQLSILEKDASIRILKYIVASAILHFKITEEKKVQPDANDVKYVIKMFEEMLNELEVKLELQEIEKNTEIAKQILKQLTAEQKELIYLLYKYNSITKICEIKEFGSRHTFYEKFKPQKCIGEDEFNIEINFDENKIYYSLLEGYPKPNQKTQAILTIEPIISNKLTKLGKEIAKLIIKEKIKEYKEQKELQKEIEQTTEKNKQKENN